MLFSSLSSSTLKHTFMWTLWIVPRVSATVSNQTRLLVYPEELDVVTSVLNWRKTQATTATKSLPLLLKTTRIQTITTRNPLLLLLRPKIKNEKSELEEMTAMMMVASMPLIVLLSEVYHRKHRQSRRYHRRPLSVPTPATIVSTGRTGTVATAGSKLAMCDLISNKVWSIIIAFFIVLKIHY